MVTLFQSKVYHLLKQIPAGKVTTYKILAEQLETKAYQAIGKACRENPFFPKIPCHRVVKNNGSLGGYQGKINNPKKEELLKKEGIAIKHSSIIDFKKYLYTFETHDHQS